MKKYLSRAAFVSFFVGAALLIGCAQLGVVTPQKFGERLAAGYTTTETLRTTTQRLLLSRAISTKDAQNAQDTITTARTGLDVANEISATNINQANDRLTVILTGLASLETYLLSRSSK